MMWYIGIFDSGLGWIQTLKVFKQQFPQYDYIYLADTAHAPYGVKDSATIQQLTFTWLHRLFNNGAEIVIIACNTAAAYAVRLRQQQYPQHKTLSVSIPSVEKVIQRWYINIWVIGTQATIQSGIYHDLLVKYWKKPDTQLSVVVAQDLVTIIEEGINDSLVIESYIQKYLDQFPPQLDALILWCTHFPIYIKYFQQLFAGDIIDPAQESVYQFWPYLDRHPDIKQRLSEHHKRIYYVTGDPLPFIDKAVNVDHHIRSIIKA